MKSNMTLMAGLTCLMTLAASALGEVRVVSRTQLTTGSTEDNNPVWRPDGGAIAFASGHDYTCCGTGKGIWLMDPDGGNQRQLLFHPWQNAGYLTWSPDAARIAYTRDVVGGGDIWSVDAQTGGDEIRLTTSPNHDAWTDWSPAGSRIGYMSGPFYGGPSWGVWLMNPDGTMPMELTSGLAGGYGLAWSPDSSQIVYSALTGGSWQLWIMDQDGSNARSLTTGSDSEPDWSPNGVWIAFKSYRAGNGDIWIIRTDGTGLTQLTTDPSYDAFPKWSPDGSRIIFEATPPSSRNADIWMLCLEGLDPCDDDTIPPTIDCPADIAIGCSTDLHVPASFSATASDDCDSSPTVIFNPLSGSGFPIGDTLVICTATDASGNQSECSFRVVRAALGFIGFLPPIGGADASGGSFLQPVRTFRTQSTIPVKFSASCDGSPVVTGQHRLQATKYSDATMPGAPIDATPQDAATTGNEFRLTDGEWHFNLDAKGAGMTAGIWLLTATLSDGSQHSVWIQLK